MLNSHKSGDEGSVLMLFPALVLVLLILGAMAADMSHARAGRAELADLADTIASDVATQGLNQPKFRETGIYESLDANVTAIEIRALKHHSSMIHGVGFDGEPRIELDAGTGQRHVVVNLHATVGYIFAKAIPGVDDNMPVKARGRAVIEGFR